MEEANRSSGLLNTFNSLANSLAGDNNSNYENNEDFNHSRKEINNEKGYTGKENENKSKNSTQEMKVRPPDSTKDANETAPRSRPQTLRLNEEEVQQLLQDVLDGASIEELDPLVLPYLINALKDDRDDKIAHHKPDDAEISDSYLHFARQRYNNYQREQFAAQRKGQMQERLETAKKFKQDLTDHLNQKEIELIEQKEMKVQEMKERHQKELDELREEWKSPNKVRKFNRSSAKVRNLRTQAIFLLNAHRYPEMRAVNRMADAQEAYETDENYRTMEAQYIYAHKLMEQKHYDELKVLIHAQDVKIAELNVYRDREMMHAQRRLDKLQREYDAAADPEKVWNLFHRNDRQKSAKGKKLSRRGVAYVKTFENLRLPPLQGPESARRESRARWNKSRNTKSTSDFF